MRRTLLLAILAAVWVAVGGPIRSAVADPAPAGPAAACAASPEAPHARPGVEACRKPSPGQPLQRRLRANAIPKGHEPVVPTIGTPVTIRPSDMPITGTEPPTEHSLRLRLPFLTDVLRT